jgi:3-oxoacyl-[acyl-carrier-protein] synthase II
MCRSGMCYQIHSALEETVRHLSFQNCKMVIYIQATANISPQRTLGPVPFLTEPIEYTGNRFKCIEPDYAAYIDAKSLRRMSRIIKMGVAAAMECLQEAGDKEPGAIITGTALGCLEDTGLFLTSIIEQKEEMLQPTPFIQSTHNTVGSQIALLLKCHGYNNTFVHRGFSFESALLDAMMLLHEGEITTVLAGSIDEITDISHAILTRFGLYKRFPVPNLSLFTSASKGSIAGEGAAYFLLASQPSASAYAQLNGVSTFYKPVDITEIEQHVLSFLSSHQIKMEDIDLVITGRSGDTKGDSVYKQLEGSVFKNKSLINYKHLSGEYSTSTSFALWLAANILKRGTVPEVTRHGNLTEDKLKRILVYNHNQNIHHSLLLVSAV